MSDLVPLMPRTHAPALSLPLVGGGTWTLNGEAPENFTMIVFYRGLHCPICKMYLGALQRMLPKYNALGVDVIAVSSDGEDRAVEATKSWGLIELKIGYDLPLAVARQWGLYLSAGRGKTSIGIEEPGHFNEPGLFLVRPDGELFYISTQSMPFSRPDLNGLIGAVEFALNKQYPARGEVITTPV